jgi:hypothetical protein
MSGENFKFREALETAALFDETLNQKTTLHNEKKRSLSISSLFSFCRFYFWALI